jgi:hypothetical protein
MPDREPKLKPCPFCGDRCPGVDHEGFAGFVVRCSKSTCQASGPGRSTERKAANAWNKRAEVKHD